MLLKELLPTIVNGHYVIECELWALAERPEFAPYFKDKEARKSLWSAISHGFDPIPSNIVSVLGDTLYLGTEFDFEELIDNHLYSLGVGLIWGETISLSDGNAFTDALKELPVARSWEETLPESEAAFDRSRIFCYSEDCCRDGFENHSFDYTRIKIDLGIKPVSPNAPTEVLDDLKRRIFAWQC